MSGDAMAPEGGRLIIETANKWLDQRAAKERDVTPGHASPGIGHAERYILREMLEGAK